VRRGETEPHRVVSAVRHDLLATRQKSRHGASISALSAVRWKRWGNHDGIARNERIVSPFDTYFDEAVDSARWAIQWDRLSDPEKQRVKAERWMAEQPPTEKQVKYLRSLGYDGEVESKLHASELIDRLLKEGRNFV